MTKRAYYSDAYTTSFEAEVIERLDWIGHPALILSHTYFYPTSGGQPFDTGQINDVPVINVEIRPDDEAIIHILEKPITGDKVKGVLNWQRRFDHMQHHTGQHILSQAFIQIANAQTVGFHMSESSITIDLDKVDISDEQILQVEQLANEIIWQDREVIIRLVSQEEAQQLALRKIPPTRNGLLRLIDIADFDLTACGGTHVRKTGEIGIIKIKKAERRGEKRRIEFCCGQRALDDYREDHQLVEGLMSSFTTGREHIITGIVKLQEENKQVRRELKRLEEELAHAEAFQLLSSGRRFKSFSLITHVFTGRDPQQVRALSKQLCNNEEVIALLGVVGDRTNLIFSRSTGAPGNMKELLNIALQDLGSKSGGGSENYAQGVAPLVNPQHVQQAIEKAEEELLGETQRMR